MYGNIFPEPILRLRLTWPRSQGLEAEQQVQSLSAGSQLAGAAVVVAGPLVAAPPPPPHAADSSPRADSVSMFLMKMAALSDTPDSLEFQTKVREDFTITEKAPSRAFS